ncbi:ligand-effect modulator 3 family [Phycomyces blakesleeanus]|uniref:Ligand-effect modulator 3 family n=1 Tax=Phycomyces blakesleeanus TaxID=4837 RepID=A0ABR3BBL3_PHYBL
MTGPVFMYYRLTNFYQNRRQYIKSYDADQLLGKAISSSTAQSNCDPAGQTEEGLIVYPCGLIANSMFNDTFSNITQIDGDNAVLYEFSSTNVAWPTDTEKYKLTTYPIDAIAPPPNWVLRYPNGKYDQDHPPPDLSTMERFMVWMHVAALPDFRKLWGRNDNQDLPAGRWRILVDMNFDTVQYKGTKWIVLSTTTALGGRNLRLGVTYISIGSICLALGVFFSIRQSARPRKLGDQAYLSWNQPGGGLPITFGLSLALFASSVLAIQDYCNPHFKPIAEAGYELDLSRLNKEFVVTQKASTVPATRTTEIKINICDALPAPKENDVDDCPKGSYICRRIIYNKDGKDIVTEVQTISGDFDKEKKLVGNFKAPEDEEDLSNDGIVYTLELGGGKVGERAQSAQITLECDKSISREPDEKKPDNGNDKKGDETPQPKEGMSGVGIFFTT